MNVFKRSVLLSAFVVVLPATSAQALPSLTEEAFAGPRESCGDCFWNIVGGEVDEQMCGDPQFTGYLLQCARSCAEEGDAGSLRFLQDLARFCIEFIKQRMNALKPRVYG